MEPQRPQQAPSSVGTSLFGLKGNSSQVGKQDDDIVSLLSEIDTFSNNDDADSLGMQYADVLHCRKKSQVLYYKEAFGNGSRQNQRACYD